ncbi:MAG: OmpA family protein [Marinilabiliaceae bacterium]|nr:OmpA family protein [Marinilabiliaceae bacterium]
MDKILTIIILTLVVSLSNTASAQQFSLSEYKKWQIKGYAKSAEKQQDIYSALIFYKYLNEQYPGNTNYLKKAAWYQYQTNDYQGAFHSYQLLDSLSKGRSVEAHYFKGLILKHQEKYHLAKKEFKAIKHAKPGKNLPKDLKLRIENEIIGCEMVLAAEDTSFLNVEITRLDNTINHKHIEINPFHIADTIMIYGSTHVDSLVLYSEKEIKPQRQFFAAKYVNGRWISSGQPPAPFNLNSDHDSGEGAFSNDGKRFYFTRCKKQTTGKNMCHLYVQERVNDSWSDPVLLGDEINHKKYSSSQLAVGTTFDPSVEVLYFISDRPGGYGETDIWYSTYNIPQKTYQKAINAGIFINTSGKEMTPHYDISQHRLYFSSDGWPGLGGLDIFFADGDMLNWSEPVNVLTPVNTSHDEVYFSTSPFNETGFFTSNRKHSNVFAGSIISDDIYFWTKTISEKVWVKGQIVGDEHELSKNLKALDTDSIHTSNKVVNDAQINLFIRKDTSQLVFMRKIQTDDKGQFKFLATKGNDYQLIIEDNRVLNKNLVLNSQDIQSVENEINLLPIEVKTISREPIRMNSIYYEFNKSELTESSKAILDSTLVILLNEFKDISIEIASHTDNIGNEKFNMRLSQKRADNVVKYLIQQGIESVRLKAIGWGELKNVAPNNKPDGSDNSAGRALNRRTEFRVIEKHNTSN